jgi:tetratricopeptide (TPR) repeat protein/serine phosphatase RsbU (regulator of sigma subunit)
MMRKFLFTLLLLPTVTFGQVNLDSLFAVWNDKSKPDTSRIISIYQYAEKGYLYSKPDSAFDLLQLGVDLTRKLGLKKLEAVGLNKQGISFGVRSMLPEALEYFTQTLKIYKELKLYKNSAACLNNIGSVYNLRGEYDKAIEKLQESLKIEKELGRKESIANTLHNIGNAYSNLGKRKEAIQHYLESITYRENRESNFDLANTLNTLSTMQIDNGNFKGAESSLKEALEIYEKTNHTVGINAALNALGLFYNKQGNSKKAIELFTKSLQLAEKSNDSRAIGNAYSNIGEIYFQLGDYDKALEYYTKSYEIRESIGVPTAISEVLVSIGQVYLDMDEDSSALANYSQALTISERSNNQSNIERALHALGGFYHENDQFEEARKYYFRSLKLAKQSGLKYAIALTLRNIGSSYHDENDFKNAILYGKQSYNIASKLDNLILIKEVAALLRESYKEANQPKEALEMFELYIQANDSIQSTANQKEVIRQEYKYAYEKQAAADSVVNAEAKKVADAKLLAEQAEKKRLKSESKRQRLENKSQEQFSHFLYGILGLALLFGAFIFNRFRVTQKQKGIIESQKNEVETQKEKVDEAYEQLEEKNTEILDSITYAKRIQEAILPPTRLVKEWLPNSFVLYKPKDIVAGDFYWMEHVGDTVIFAAADCTGHGVPGAMVSVVCHNAMNRSVREFGLTDPGKILDKTNELVEDTFAKSDEEVKDGMDLALCSLTGNTLKYAGAHNPLWIIRNGEIIETKANKLPIGSFNEHQPYTTHAFELQPNDVFYIFSDGYVDQFGGERGKKFKPKALRELLLSVQGKTMEDQRIQINQAFENWRGDLEQVDDVCIIGVRV